LAYFLLGVTCVEGEGKHRGSVKGKAAIAEGGASRSAERNLTGEAKERPKGGAKKKIEEQPGRGRTRKGKTEKGKRARG